MELMLQVPADLQITRETVAVDYLFATCWVHHTTLAQI